MRSNYDTHSYLDVPCGICPQEQMTKRTGSRCRAAVAIALILATALVLGTYINARWGGPTSITMTPEGAPAGQPAPWAPLEKDNEQGGHISLWL